MPDFARLTGSCSSNKPMPPRRPQPSLNRRRAPFSASLALAFFAHRFIEIVPIEKSGTSAFCEQGVKVNSWQLVTELPIIAFWYLYENNCIRFTPTAKTAFLRNDVTLVIEANPASQPGFPCLEHDFWEIIKRSPPGVTVETVFKQFLGGRDTEPEKNLGKRLIAWMIQLGYGQPDNSPKPFSEWAARRCSRSLCPIAVASRLRNRRRKSFTSAG